MRRVSQTIALPLYPDDTADAMWRDFQLYSKEKVKQYLGVSSIITGILAAGMKM